MKLSEDVRLLEIIKATGEIYSRQVSTAAAVMFLADLDGFDSSQILNALSICRKQLKTFPSIADVIARIDDGHPGVEEAWAMIPKEEEGSIVWTNEMVGAFGIARNLLLDGDAIAARMAFKESYTQMLATSRSENISPNWFLSPGHDKTTHEPAVREALSKKRISIGYARDLLPEIEFKNPATLAIPDQSPPLQKPINFSNLLKDMPK
jgi:hypothetical protein